jgi:hypothetical protein
MKGMKGPKKKLASNRKSPLKAIRLQEVRFTSKAKGNDYPSIPS